MRAGNKVNVITGRASVDIDGRTIPGQSELAFLAELREMVGPDAEVEVLHSLPSVETDANTPLYGHLEAMLRKHDPFGEPLPYMVVGFTDAKAYARLGTHCYGFSPVKFDPTHEVSFPKNVPRPRRARSGGRHSLGLRGALRDRARLLPRQSVNVAPATLLDDLRFST